ncbi:hypothetical protein B0F90DRAFT_1627344 [Multifurca ochricompacta]|uniref:Pinin/SDK/MemA protein domain-containing protein n=1 Tax=Multifurca ochricompacta TaxID=376703 RepID=A0AAD4QLL2_9AGAM|nr:hypothetical protein B0F90DRAFT_1627344 [Multifurca ochricompacta]
MQDAQSVQATAAAVAAPKKRPRLDLNIESRERKRGKSMFGLLVGTLNKAKTEDEARNASDAAKKRQSIDKRLQDRLRKEIDTVRRAEEAKKDKHSANRKEEETQLKNSIHRLRRTRLPILANFLLTSDVIPSGDSIPPPSYKWILEPLRSHPPPLYYLPAVLMPTQEVFISKRKAEAAETAEKEWSLFLGERDATINEIRELRRRVVEEEARKQAEREAAKADENIKPDLVHNSEDGGSSKPEPSLSEARMDVDETLPEEGHGSNPKQDSSRPDESERKDDSATMQADDDDAVEY